ncbi:hypothetical protein NSQ20_12480 [Paenibacillus sp. FSL K6-1122]|uniref:hypothetical protein n=1 Tax=Paenibacillus sp. FSL K6-1122 TaxID=2954512 RepID=UPI0030EC8C9E
MINVEEIAQAKVMSAIAKAEQDINYNNLLNSLEEQSQTQQHYSQNTLLMMKELIAVNNSLIFAALKEVLIENEVRFLESLSHDK